jgi:hypothetical protein
MRTVFLAALMSTTALLGPTAAYAQTQPQVTPETAPAGEVQARAAISECDRLITYLEQSRPANPGVTPEQVTEWRNTANAQPCHDNLRRLTESSERPTNINPLPTPQTGSPLNAAPVAPASPVTPNAAASSTDQPAPRVLVQQAQPNVTVRQAQPEIIVRQAPPVITVQQPQPEIIVRMPEPDVNVSMAQPQVQVTMPQPQVQVVAPRQQQQQTNVQVQRQQPNVRFERTGEPQIIYRQAEGQPQIRFEPMAGPASAAAATTPAQPPAEGIQSAQAQLNAAPGYATNPAQGAPADTTRATGPEPQQTGALPGSGVQSLRASQLEDMAVYTARDEKLGDVEQVMMGPDNKVYLVVTHGGFLGLGERKVAMSLEQVAIRGDRLVAEGMNDEQIKAIPAFDKDSANYREVEDGHTASLRMLQ